MGKCTNIILFVVPWICALFLTVSIVTVIISLNEDVKWNEYHDIPLPVDGLLSFYFHNLWSSTDAAKYDVQQVKYYSMLKEQSSDSWKVPIRRFIYIGITVACISLISLFVSLAVHAATNQKLYTVILLVISCLTELFSGCIILLAAVNFKDGLALSISENSLEYYHKEKGQMKLGFYMAIISAIIMILVGGLTFIHTYLYIRYSKGQWHCKKGVETEVKPF